MGKAERSEGVDIFDEALAELQAKQAGEWVEINRQIQAVMDLVEVLQGTVPADARVVRCRQVHEGLQRAKLALEDASDYARPVEEWDD